MLRDRTDRAWFSRLLRHAARKRSGSILSTPEPALAEGQLTPCDMVSVYAVHDCKALVTTTIYIDCDSTSVRRPLDCNSTALRPFHDLRYNRRPNSVCGLLHCIV